ncbi:dienelactone hydrolase family protein [Meiothermus hypogaeus]|uniref:Dienelactone hydrolase n=2 Tax=Meiothermus hypogaeus TaxID=884155 RepID=A0A511R1K1_9DEIN|nr:dienelactone hydrolase family protein [Meiothermus hypogaeus]RIH75784.1 Carboxymethylenebutenolidase [Meiothermus hypogaeus]GEM83485.1 dienelactone hydrolase [Meiothermus hypogaeus NBRC 106114]
MSIVLKILAWVAGILGLAVVALVLSVVVDAALDGNRLETLTNTRISPEVQAYVAKPEGSGSFPAIIMIHEFWGLRQEIVDKAQLLSEQGYVVVAPDTYRNQKTDWIPRAIYLSATTPPQRVNQDLDSVFKWLSRQPEVDAARIAVMGFCYGGTAALNYSLHNNQIAATGIFYGQLVSDPETLGRLPGPVLGIFGSSDNLIPLEEVKAFKVGLEQAGIPHEIKVYEGQGHAFVQSVDEIKKGGAQGEAWQQLVDFLQRNLKQRPRSEAEPLLTTLPANRYGNPTPGNLLEVTLAHWNHRSSRVHQH